MIGRLAALRLTRTPALGSRARCVLWSMIAIGVLGRAVLAFKTYGIAYDIDSQKAVHAALTSHPLHVFSAVNGHPFNRWPYPSGFFPWILAAGGLASATHTHFDGWVQLPEIFADGAIAWLVQDHLGARGAGERLRLVATAL